jgi:hypothetical protein
LKTLSGDYKSRAEELFAPVLISVRLVTSDNVSEPFGEKTLDCTSGDRQISVPGSKPQEEQQ